MGGSGGQVEGRRCGRMMWDIGGWLMQPRVLLRARVRTGGRVGWGVERVGRRGGRRRLLLERGVRRGLCQRRQRPPRFCLRSCCYVRPSPTPAASKSTSSAAWLQLSRSRPAPAQESCLEVLLEGEARLLAVARQAGHHTRLLVLAHALLKEVGLHTAEGGGGLVRTCDRRSLDWRVHHRTRAAASCIPPPRAPRRPCTLAAATAPAAAQQQWHRQQQHV